MASRGSIKSMKLQRLQSDNKLGIAIALTLIALAVVSRIMPHPANFAPIAAVALFSGAILPRKLAISVPLLAMIISDLFIGLHPLIMFTWGTFALIAFLSSAKFRRVTPLAVVGSSAGASVLFYLVTNFGVWMEGRLYAQTFSGLVQCYYNALPFFRNTLLGDVIFTSALFGIYAFSVELSKKHLDEKYITR
ncbi:MAG: hypothetical protein Q7T41_01090 [Candidatus Saccharibacteria bacterium]|nr:hypothetical protein [Candidatus Saccharibacteria bacterium]